MVRSLSRLAAAAGATAMLTLLADVRSQAPETRAFCRVDGPERVWLQQPVTLAITIGWQRDWFERNAVPVFRRRLDVPFHVEVPWLLGAPERAVELVPPTAAGPDGATLRLAVGNRVAVAERLADELRDGRTFARLRLRARWLPLAAGNALIAPVKLRFGYATEFTDDVLRGRQPVDRKEALVQSAVRELMVDALPKPRPPGFSGAVGEFAVAATSGGERLRVGQSFGVELVITGDGNLERFAKLPPPELAGFHVDAVVERRRDGARVFQLDVIALRAGQTEVPAIPFVSFSPQRGDYVTASAPPVPVMVDPVEDAATLPPRVRELVAADRARLAAAARWPWWVWACCAAAALAVARMLFVDVQRRRRRAGGRAALRRLRDSAAGAEPASVLAAFEALVLELAPAEPDAASEPFALARVEVGLRGAGVPSELLQQLTVLHGELDQARYGGPAPAAERVVALAERLADGLG